MRGAKFRRLTGRSIAVVLLICGSAAPAQGAPLTEAFRAGLVGPGNKSARVSLRELAGPFPELLPKLARSRESWSWLGGDTQALQAATHSDAFWESGSSIEPPTGREARRRGSALLALGLLRTATSIMHVVFGSSKRCGPGKGLDWSEDSCSNLRLYGYLGMGLSAAFLAGGSIELGRGLMLKRRHDQWKTTHWDHFHSQY